MRKAKAAIYHRQHAWAQRADCGLDAKGYIVPDAHGRPSENFFGGLDEETWHEFAKADGGEGRSRTTRTGAVIPAKMLAPHSSSVLAVNVFKFWRGPNGDLDLLARALGSPGGLTDIRFERKFPTGVRSAKANLDVLLTHGDGVVAVESKLAEPFPRRSKPKTLKDAYVPDSRDSPARRRVWRGLDRCRELADEMHQGRRNFHYLDAPQLLKHALGLAGTGQSFRLMLLWYDPSPDGAPEVAALREELALFQSLIDERLDFQALPYQELFAAIAEACRGRTEFTNYLDYLRDRYF